MARPPNFMLERTHFLYRFVVDLEKPYTSFLTEQLNQIIGKNEALHGAPCYYIGDTIYARGLTIAKIGKYKLGGMVTLDPSLQGLHDEFLEHYQEHKESWTRFSQSLRVLLMSAESWQDLRDMFPDYVMRPYLAEHFNDLPRTREDLHTASLQEHSDTWDPKLPAEYARIADKLDLYVGYRLL